MFGWLAGYMAGWQYLVSCLAVWLVDWLFVCVWLAVLAVCTSWQVLLTVFFGCPSGCFWLTDCFLLAAWVAVWLANWLFPDCHLAVIACLAGCFGSLTDCFWLSRVVCFRLSGCMFCLYGWFGLSGLLYYGWLAVCWLFGWVFLVVCMIRCY